MTQHPGGKVVTEETREEKSSKINSSHSIFEGDSNHDFPGVLDKSDKSNTRYLKTVHWS